MWLVRRAVWFLTAVSVSLLSEEKFNTFKGNVTDQCMVNGSFYSNTLCGPIGAEELPFATWSHLYSPAEYDVDLIQEAASELVLYGSWNSIVAGGEGPTLAVEAGESWFFRSTSLDSGGTLEEQTRLAASRFTYLTCKIWRGSDAGQSGDQPQRFDDFPSGSLARITSAWAWKSCRRFKHEVFGQFSRDVHNFGLELSMCLEDAVQCALAASPCARTSPPTPLEFAGKKDFERCIGSCSGETTSTVVYDFATSIAVSELNADVVGEDGFAAAAADCIPRTAVLEIPWFDGGDR